MSKFLKKEIQYWVKLTKIEEKYSKNSDKIMDHLVDYAKESAPQMVQALSSYIESHNKIEEFRMEKSNNMGIVLNFLSEKLIKGEKHIEDLEKERKQVHNTLEKSSKKLKSIQSKEAGKVEAEKIKEIMELYKTSKSTFETRESDIHFENQNFNKEKVDSLENLLTEIIEEEKKFYTNALKELGVIIKSSSTPMPTPQRTVIHSPPGMNITPMPMPKPQAQPVAPIVVAPIAQPKTIPVPGSIKPEIKPEIQGKQAYFVPMEEKSIAFHQQKKQTAPVQEKKEHVIEEKETNVFKKIENPKKPTDFLENLMFEIRETHYQKEAAKRIQQTHNKLAITFRQSRILPEMLNIAKKYQDFEIPLDQEFIRLMRTMIDEWKIKF